QVFGAVADIENAKTFSRIGVDIKNTDLLTSARSFPAFSDLVRYRDLAGREDKDAPGVWQLGGAISIGTLLTYATRNGINYVANFVAAGNADFIEWQEGIGGLSCGSLDTVAGAAPCSDETALRPQTDAAADNKVVLPMLDGPLRLI